MIVFDLFEQDPNFRKPVEYENRKQYGTVNLANFIKAYQNNQPVQFDFPGGKSYKLTAQWVDMLAEYYNTLETNNDKAQLVYDVLTDYNKTIRLLNELAQSKLFEKKSSEKVDNPEFKSAKLARLKTQARAKYPAASSDLEAMTADFVDSQEADQQEFQQVKSTNKKQDELLKQITAINQQQDREIDGLDSDNSDLQKNLQQLRAVNTELAKKLADMAKRKPKEKSKEKEKTSATTTATTPATSGNWIPPSAADTGPDWTTAAPTLAQPGISTATPATVGGQPATVLAKRKRRSKAEIDAEKASKAAMAAMTKMAGGAKIKPVQPDIAPAPTVGEPTAVPPAISKVIDLFPNATPDSTTRTTTAQDADNAPQADILDFPGKLQRQAAESINEADAIPLKSVVQGYQVDYNPRTRQVTVSRRGQVIGRGTNRLNSAKYHLTLINRIIDQAEEDKYPTDIDDRDVALPTKRVAEALPAKAAKELYRWKNQQNQPQQKTTATAIPAEPQPVAYQPPARLSDLQLKKQRVDNLASIKQTIEQLQARATRGGRMLPRGLAADLEDYFTVTDIDTAYDDMMAKYQKQLAALQQYLGMRKALWSLKKDTHEMRAKELEEARSTTWTAYFTDGTKATISNVNDETDPARVRAFLAKKGKTVDRFDYGFGASSDTVSKPEPHEPGSGTARSTRTGEELPEGDVVNINRGGFNAFRDRADWLDKRDYVQQQLLDPRQRDNLPELKQRLLDINSAGRKLGYTK